MTGKIKEQPKKFRIFRGDNWYIARSEFEEMLDSQKGLREVFREEKYSIKKNHKASYRIINHWTEIGLIDDNRESENQWRRFSMVQLVWQRIILELRKFGFPNEKILKTKKSIFDQKDGYIFDFYISQVLMVEEPKPVFVLVFENGDAELVLDSEIISSEKLDLLNENYIKINLNNILQGIFTKKDLKPVHDINIPLNRKELDVIRDIRNGKYESVKVTLLNGEVEMISGEEKIETKRRIVEIIEERNFQDIEIKKQQGQIVSLTRIAKKKY